MFRKFLILCGIVLGYTVATLHAQTPVAETRHVVTGARDFEAAFENSWYGAYMNGKKSGFLHLGLDRVTQDGQTFYRATQRFEAKLIALGEKGEIKAMETHLFDTRPPYALVRAESLLDDGQSKKRVVIEARGKGSYEATITIGKETSKVTRTGLDYSMADVVGSVMWVRRGPAVGEQFTGAALDLERIQVRPITIKRVGSREVVRDGVKMTLSEIEKVESRGVHTERSTVLCDANGFMVSGSLGPFEMRRENEAEAKKTEFPEDMIFKGMVRLEGKVGDNPKGVKALVLRGKGKINELLPQTDLQKVIHEGDDRYVVKIGKHHGSRIRATKAEIAEALEGNETYPITHPKVVELAKKAIGDAKTDREKVERLCQFVNGYIKYEIVYLPKVHDIVERKVGDCKSYALFFTCLARAVGLPAREAGGYLYMGDQIQGFGGHAWNEVLLDGHWVPIDATLGLTDLPPFYLCVHTGSNAGERMSRTMGRLSYELMEVEMR